MHENNQQSSLGVGSKRETKLMICLSIVTPNKLTQTIRQSQKKKEREKRKTQGQLVDIYMHIYVCVCDKCLGIIVLDVLPLLLKV